MRAYLNESLFLLKITETLRTFPGIFQMMLPKKFGKSLSRMDDTTFAESRNKYVHVYE